MNLPRHSILFETIVGSRAYGTARPESDEDIKGVYAEAATSLLTLRELPDQIDDARGDVVFYALRRFLALALKANPNIIELLFMPDDCVRLVRPSFERILAERRMFVTRQAYVTHVNYAQAQIKKARGQNKWVNHPQPKSPPEPRDFCWFIPKDRGEAMPYRPIPIDRSGIRLAECHVAAVEHGPNLYRLYHYGPSARGVFRGGKIVCTGIPIDDENKRCIGLLIFNEDAYERARLDHRNYWDWRANRNETRWQAQESGELDYDAKNLMHMFRLMLSAEHILTGGVPLVRFEGEKLEFLRSVRDGAHDYADLMREAEALKARLDKLHEASKLPERPDIDRAEALLREVTMEWESQHV